MTFFHFTHPLHLPTIIDAGFLKTVESNVSFAREHAGPDVVWLLDQAEPDWPEEMAHGLYPDKRKIRFEVDVPAIQWTRWAPAAQMDPVTKAVMIGTAGGIEAAKHWYVYPAPITARRWVSITNMDSGTRVPLTTTV